MFFPAHSIKEAMERVEATKDPLVKVAMADKLDPFLIGAYQDAIQASKQYIEQVTEAWNVPDRNAVVSAFTDKYKSHGYPIDCKVLTQIGVPHTQLVGEAEQVVGDIHDKCVDLLGDDDGAIIMTSDEYFFRLEDFKESGKFTTPTQQPLPMQKAGVATA